MLYGLNC
ncbi:hypothetical protein LINPERPRIM_LOCUS29288 [Linum perenne]